MPAQMASSAQGARSTSPTAPGTERPGSGPAPRPASRGKRLTAEPATDPLPAPDTTPRDGRRELRLVRIRLVLAMLTVGLLPVLVLVPAMRFLTDDAVHSQADRLGLIATEIAAGASADLEGTRRAVLQLAADTSLVDALRGAKAPKGAVADAAAGLLGLSESSPAIASATVLDRAGAPQLTLADGEISTASADDPPEPDGVFRTALTAPAGTITRALGPLDDPLSGTAVDGLGMDLGAVLGTAAAVPEVVGRRLTLATPLMAADEGDPAPGVLRVDVSLAALLVAAAGDQIAPGRSIQLVDLEHETAVATLATSADPMSLPDRVLDLATDIGTGGMGGGDVVAIPLEVPGLSHLAIAVQEPLPVASLPVPAVGAVSLLILLAGMLVVWMSRQILRPAEELASSRGQFADLYQEARIAALRDSLTGLGNHRAFQEELDRQLDQSQRYRVPMSLVIIDLDEFKLVNDAHGHAVGDRVLNEVARIIRATIRHADRAFRIGGDEFAVILPHTDSAGGDILARRLLQRMLADRPHSEYPLPISFSAGVVAAPEHGSSRLQLFAEADAALYWGKRHGRTLVSTYDPIRDRKAIDETMRTELSASVASVVSDRALHVAYQPIIHLPTGRVLGYEGLIRVPASSGFSGPASLFAAAEATGHTFELDRACLETTVAGSVQIPDPLLITLNLSPRSFEAPEFSASSLLAILQRNGLDPSRVILELTERETIEDMDRVVEALEECRAAGIRIAADDVGAGNAGLRLLSQFKFDVMKIDLSLVQAGAGREPVLAVLGSLVDLAQRWGALTVAEGVETPEQLRAIRRLGIDAAQGYLLGRPGDVTGLERVDLDALSEGDGWDSPMAAYERMVEAAESARPTDSGSGGSGRRATDDREAAAVFFDPLATPTPTSGYVAGVDGVVAVRHPGYPDPRRLDSWESGLDADTGASAAVH